MNIRIRLDRLEEKRRIKSGVVLLFIEKDGTARFTTQKNEKKNFASEEAALEYINGNYDDAAVVIIDL